MPSANDILDDVWDDERFDVLREIEGIKAFGDKIKICVSSDYLLFFDKELSLDGYIRKIRLEDIQKISFSKGNGLEVTILKLIFGGPLIFAYYYFEAVEAQIIVLVAVALILFLGGKIFEFFIEEKPHGFRLKYRVEEEHIISYFDTNFQKADLKQIDKLIIANRKEITKNMNVT